MGIDTGAPLGFAPSMLAGAGVGTYAAFEFGMKSRGQAARSITVGAVAGLVAHASLGSYRLGQPDASPLLTALAGGSVAGAVAGVALCRHVPVLGVIAGVGLRQAALMGMSVGCATAVLAVVADGVARSV